MNILVFTSLYPNNIWPHHGVFVKERMAGFARLEGCHIKVVAPIPYFPPIKIGAHWRFSQILRKETIEGTEVFHPRYLVTPKIGMALYGLSMFLSVVRTVRQIRKGFDFDLIDAHYVYPDGFAAVLLGRFFHKPVVVSARGSDINLYQTFPIIRRLLRVTLRKAARVVAVSQALKEAITGLGIPNDKISVVGNAVDATKFFRIPKTEARARLGFGDEKIILSVGGLTPVKGFDFLIRAFDHLRKESEDKSLILIILGEGAERQELEGLIVKLGLRDRVRLPGAVGHHELAAWYSAADLFCLTSIREGCPNVVIEAMACGTPVVAVPVGGVPEIIKTETVGLLAPRMEQEFAHAIARALQTKWRPEEIARYASAHTWDHVALSLRQLFTAVLDESRNCSRNHALGAARTDVR